MSRRNAIIGLALLGFGLGLLLLWLFLDDDPVADPVANGSRLSEAELIAKNREPPPAASAPATAPAGSSEPPALTPSWLAGTWRPAADRDTRDPNAPCETDVVVTFYADGRYEHGDGSSGRFRTSGDQEVTFFEHVIREMGTDEEDRSEFDAQSRRRIVPIDANTMRSEGEEMVRCRIG